jgi:fumarate hydratase subunit beta
MKRISAPLTKADISGLIAGEEVLLSGIIYTARDQAHKRLVEAIEKNKKVPFDLKDAIIYYCGPTPAPRGKIIGTSTLLSVDGEHSRTIGSAGPTTSSRMDEFTPALLRKGVLATIGKGRRSGEVIEAIKKYKAVYFLTYAGCGALLSKFVKENRPVAYKDLGPEAIYKLEVEDFPLIVGIDAKGRSIYD